MENCCLFNILIDDYQVILTSHHTLFLQAAMAGANHEILWQQKNHDMQRDLETSDRKIKDLQLRLKRSTKDGQLKDDRMAYLEKEIEELRERLNKVEDNNNASAAQTQPKETSSVCIIL
jgi:peptidoglycan hydrolase CwlO-like protein